jgi:hypothetical protein
MRVLLDQGLPRSAADLLRADATADLVLSILKQCDTELSRGAMISVTENRIRIRYLPV